VDVFRDRIEEKRPPAYRSEEREGRPPLRPLTWKLGITF
jgi:hypothetical protein